MSRSVQIGSVVLVVALALALVRLVGAGRGERQAAPGVEERAPSLEPSPELAAELVAPPPSGEAERALDGLDSRDQPRGERTALLDARPSLGGRVVMAKGGLLPEPVRVVAEVHREEGLATERASASVAADGSFTLFLPAAVRAVWLDIEAASLALAETPAARPGDKNVVLVAHRLARIELEAVLPPEVAWDAAALAEVRAGLHGTPGHGLDRRRRPEDTLETLAFDARGRCSFARVPIEVELWLDVTSPFGPAWAERLDPFAEGETRSLRAELATGIHVAGRVLDQHGEPVAGVRVMAREPRSVQQLGAARPWPVRAWSISWRRAPRASRTAASSSRPSAVACACMRRSPATRAVARSRSRRERAPPSKASNCASSPRGAWSGACSTTAGAPSVA
jgi:hypothetical protein